MCSSLFIILNFLILCVCETSIWKDVGGREWIVHMHMEAAYNRTDYIYVNMILSVSQDFLMKMYLIFLKTKTCYKIIRLR